VIHDQEAWYGMTDPGADGPMVASSWPDGSRPRSRAGPGLTMEGAVELLLDQGFDDEEERFWPAVDG
jgi:hypothetical protein